MTQFKTKEEVDAFVAECYEAFEKWVKDHADEAEGLEVLDQIDLYYEAMMREHDNQAR